MELCASSRRLGRLGRSEHRPVVEAHHVHTDHAQLESGANMERRWTTLPPRSQIAVDIKETGDEYPIRGSRTGGQVLRRLVAAAASAAVLLLPACSDASSGGGGGSTVPTETASEVAPGVNQEDVSFAQTMAPHHDHAVSMCTMLLDKRGVKSEVRDLAEQIVTVRESQIETLNGWNQSWDPGLGHDDEADDDSTTSHHGGPGVLNEREMAELDMADGFTGQRLFLEGMIRHHQGAVAIAEAEVAAGTYQDAVELAKEIAATQKTEIAAMEQSLTQL